MAVDDAGRAPAATGRKLAPDLARGAMLLLIAMAYAAVYAGSPFGTDASGAPVVDRVASGAMVLFLDNRAFPMFAILFGYGLAWTVGRQRARRVEEPVVRRSLRRRGGYLLLFGFVHAFLVFPGEILASYGVATLLLGWLLLRGTRTITTAAVVCGVVYLVLVPLVAIAVASAGGGGEFTIPGYTSAEDWIARLVGLPFAPVFVALGYPLLLLVVLGFRAGRLGVLDDVASHRRLLVRVAVGGITVSVLGAVPMLAVTLGALPGLGAVPAGLLAGLQILTGVAGGAGYAAAFALLALRWESAPGPVARAVSAAGRRSLTCYLLNSVLVAVVLQPDLVGLGTVVGSAGALLVAALVWVATVLLSARLETAGRPGPADALMRRLVHR